MSFFIPPSLSLRSVGAGPGYTPRLLPSVLEGFVFIQEEEGLALESSLRKARQWYRWQGLQGD